VSLPPAEPFQSGEFFNGVYVASVLAMPLLIHRPKKSVKVMNRGVKQLRATTVFFSLLQLHPDRLAGIFVAILCENIRNLP
jgi:hypothetical protein